MSEATSGPKADEPETKTTYWLYRQALYDDGSVGPWEPGDHKSDDLGEIEAIAARFASRQNPRWSDRRNYAVVKVSARPVRIHCAPMRAG